MGLTNIENTPQSLQKYEAVLEFISLIRDVVGKNGTVPDNIKKDIETIKELMASHQKILDENNEIYAKHQKEYASFSSEKKEHLANVNIFNASKETTINDFIVRERAIRTKEIAANTLAKEQEVLSGDLIKREQDVTRREVAATSRELVIKKSEKENADFKTKLDIRYSALTKPLE